MFKRWMRMISLILVAALLFNLLPAQAMAQYAQANADISDSLPEDPEQAEILGEVVENRTEYSKEYVLSNGLHMAQVYAYPVHYYTEEGWKDIDNTLTAAGDSYSNAAGVWDVAFPRELGAGKPISITKDGYTLSFSLAGEINGSGGFQFGLIRIGEMLASTEAAEVFAQVEDIDLTALKEAVQYAETISDKLYSRLHYAGVYQDTNVVYDLDSNKVKESIVMEQYDAALRGYRYTLNTGSLVPVLGEDGHIDFYDESGENIILVMPAPFLVDAEDNYSYNVGVSLEGDNGQYTLIYFLPQAWLASSSRAWPVVLDPVVQPSMDINNIRDCNVSTNWEYSHTSGTLDVGVFSGVGVARAFLKYDALPALTSADVVVYAQINLYKPYSRDAAPVEVHEVLGSWKSETVTWANMPDHNPTVEDYMVAGDAGWYYWDVTNIARKWYATGNNYGMLFRSPDYVENGSAGNYREFWSSDFGVTSLMPTLSIYFRNTNGLESYWDYTAASAGRAGTGYVNSYTGNLVWTRTHMGFGGSRMPVTVSHVYSANDSTLITTDGNNANDSGGNYFGLGNGWRTNFHQRIFRWDVDSNYYCWEDEDGTDHYFVWQEDAYKDEDGLELKLTINNNSTAERYVIEDKYGSKRMFDQHGRLTEMRNNQETTTSIRIAYTTASGSQISTVTDGAGRIYTYSYTDGLLSRISYYGTGDKEFAWVSFQYTGTNLTGITDQDGQTAAYTYDGNILTGARENADAEEPGYRLEYTYQPVNSAFQPYRVATVTEYDGDVKGSFLSLSYGNNQTVLEDHLENKQILQFNNFGNVVSIQDSEGHAQYAQYARNTDSDSGKGNQLTLSSKMQNTVGNMLINHNFETGSAWEYVGSAEVPFLVDTEYYLGKWSLQLVGGRTARQYPVSVEAGKTYTFSAYVKTTESSAKLGLLTDSGWVYSQELSANSDWTRLQVSYTVQTETQIVPAITTQGGAYSYMDCVQLECAATASRYSLIENGDFSYSGSPAYSWTGTGLTAADCLTTQAAGAPQLDDNVFTVTGDFYTQKQLSQKVEISGAAGDSFVLSGWAKGDSVPLREEETNPRRFGLRLTFHYTDGETSEETVNFNPDTGYWQYASTPAVAKKSYSSVTVTLLYDYNANTVFFDGIQLYKETFGVSYTYDDDGNVTSVVDLQKKKTTYEYKNNDLTAIQEDNKAKMTYEYDGHHNVIKATTELGQTYTFAYDTYGNNTAVSIGADDKRITSTAAYTTDGHRIRETTDAAGNITRYSYDADTGLLNWVQYPEDDENSRTEYTYDSMFRMASAAVTTDTGLSLNAAYSYTEEGLLDTIQTPTTTYTFTYGTFDLRESVKVGTRLLASYAYDTYNRLSALTYGNGDKVEYEYDHLSRVTRETYENGEYIAYQYDNDGNLATVYDSATGITTTYYYDLLGRALCYTKQGADDLSVSYTYDSDNNLESLTETVNGDTQSYRYTYDEDNRLTSVNVNGITVTYTYDGFGRVTEKVTTQGEATVKTEVYTFVDWSKDGVSYTTTQVASYRVVTDSTDITWTYTYDDNGNILTVSDGTSLTSYVYDSANQLIRENNQAEGYTHTWTYDAGGNIQSRKAYAYTTGSLENVTPTDTVSYLYKDAGVVPIPGENEFEVIPFDPDLWGDGSPSAGDNEFEILPFGGEEETETEAEAETESETDAEEETEPQKWGDLLTSYDGKAITYDEIGNPLTWGSRSFTWQHGRQLSTLTENGTTWTYTYGADGLRTGRTNGTTTYSYVYNGSQLVQMTVGRDTLRFAYDATGVPLAVTCNGIAYYYVTNLQGDVVAIVDADGTELVRYTYDAWGKLLSTTGTMAATLGANNPLRYRGYVYDTETGLYYLQSRYYDPVVGRFVNADIFAATGQGFSGNNMFAYCGNNPVMRSDVSGNWWDIFWDVVSLVVSVVEVINNPTDPWAWAGLAGDAVDVLLPCVTGVGEATRAATTALDVIDDVHDASRAVDNATDTIKAVDNTVDSVKAGWHVGDDITNLTKAGNTPSWSTLRQRYWKNQAHYYPELYPDDLARLKKGLAPMGEDGFSMELHHPLGREGENFYIFEPLTQSMHRLIHYGS